ncbi:class I SAM-dependent methyltransferase [Jannaschia sp. Os4]|nr:class I SAM-dependent methyltransferase [Jannaschia sp. Os4]
MGGANPFRDGGAAYAAHRPTYPTEVADALAAACGRREHALDVGCGSGQLSTLLAARFDRVTATDPSADQIASAAPHPRVAYRVEPAERIGLAAASVDLLTAAQAAHWFDLDAFHAEARRVVRPGGLVALLCYGVPTLGGAVGARFARFYWDEIHPHWPAARRHVEEGYRGLPFPYPEAALPETWIVRDWPRDALLGYVRTWSAVRRAEAAGQGATLAAFEADLAALWPDPREARRVRWPVVGRLGRVG